MDNYGQQIRAGRALMSVAGSVRCEYTVVDGGWGAAFSPAAASGLLGGSLRRGQNAPVAYHRDKIV